MGTVGTDLLKQLMDGEFEKPTSEAVSALRLVVVPALTELLERGYRARPLSVAGEQVGMVRGLHLSERKQLFLWYTQPDDRIQHIISLATTLTPPEIENLDGYEAQQVLGYIDAMTDADMSLYPYILAYSTTRASELLWYSRGTGASPVVERLPDGSCFRFIGQSEHTRLWVGVSLLREQSKRRLDATYNAAMITRALTGKGSDKLYAALRKQQIDLLADSDVPWTKLTKVDAASINFKDGWGHTLQDDSIEGTMREIAGMEKVDKHEKFLDEFYQKQIDDAKRLDDEMAARLAAVSDRPEIMETVTILTSAEVRDMDRQTAEAQRQLNQWSAEGILDIQAKEERKEARHPNG